VDSNPLSFWYCCLHPAEKDVLFSTANALPAFLFVGIPLAVWDLFWTLTAHNEEVYKLAFRSLYHLEIGTMVIDTAEVEAIVPAEGFLGWWVEASLYMLLPESLCPDGCKQSQRP